MGTASDECMTKHVPTCPRPCDLPLEKQHGSGRSCERWPDPFLAAGLIEHSSTWCESYGPCWWSFEWYQWSIFQCQIMCHSWCYRRRVSWHGWDLQSNRNHVIFSWLESSCSIRPKGLVTREARMDGSIGWASEQVSEWASEWEWLKRRVSYLHEPRKTYNKFEIKEFQAAATVNNVFLAPFWKWLLKLRFQLNHNNNNNDIQGPWWKGCARVWERDLQQNTFATYGWPAQGRLFWYKK